MGELATLIHSVDRGRKWKVEFDGELIVENSKDPECDMARAFWPAASPGGKGDRCRYWHAQVHLRHREAIQAQNRGGPHGPRFVKIRQETIVDRPQTAETSSRRHSGAQGPQSGLLSRRRGEGDGRYEREGLIDLRGVAETNPLNMLLQVQSRDGERVTWWTFTGNWWAFRRRRRATTELFPASSAMQTQQPAAAR